MSTSGNEKTKVENYRNLGGINSKASPYITGPLEFLDLKNLDFQTPGSLSERWGSTMYFGQTFPGKVNALFEFSYLDGSSYVLASYSGGIYCGATTGQNQGMSLTNVGSTLRLAAAVPYLSLSFSAGPLWGYGLATSGLGVYYQGSTSNPTYGGNLSGGDSFYINPPAVQSDNSLDSAMLDNWLFFGDGNKYLKFNGTSTYAVGLPPPLWASSGTNFGGTFSSASWGSLGVAVPNGVSFGTYFFFASYLNNRGFEGPIWPLFAFNSRIDHGTFIYGDTVGMFTASIIIATPLSYGISAINIYSYYDNSTPTFGFGANNIPSAFQNYCAAKFWNLEPVFMQSVPASGTSFTAFPIGVTSPTGFTNITSNLGIPRSTVPNSYLPLGLTLSPISSFGRTVFDYEALTSFYPRYIESYQNALFLAGFSAMPSSVYFSDTGEPEGYAPDANFEVRSNDGDVITGLKAYSTRLYVFKKNSFHALSGDNKNNFFLQEISNQYGCLNNRCHIVFDDTMLFLDQKGVMQWNGANLSNISTKVQPIFERMNVDAAISSACMVHDKLRNQVLIAIPYGESTSNNLTVVYDYLLNAWTTYDGVQPTVMAKIKGRNITTNTFYGTASGVVNWFGSSFLSDNGVGFSTYLKSRFLHPMGYSTQEMFRRLYLDADMPSATLAFRVNFYQDYGTSVVLATSLVLSQFQQRIDFGIPAKSIAFEMSNIQTNDKLRIHGFTVESQLLRRV